MKRLILYISISLFSMGLLRSQDFQFSQFYATPMLINPAFTGNTVQSRFTANYRNQWSAVQNSVGYNTFAAAYEHNFDDLNSGFGLQMIHDRAGNSALQTTQVMFSYAYRIRLNRKFSIKPGLQFGVGNRHVNFDRLIFNDQLQTGASTSVATQDYIDRSRYFMDINTGIIGYTKFYWVGISLHHLNTPDIGLVGNGVRLNAKFSVHGGYKLALQKDIKKRIKSAVTFAFNYKTQGDRDQLDIGGYFNYVPVIIGLWYRGIPFKNINSQLINNESIIVLIGYSKNGFRMGYSYDLTISRLGAATSGGAHELSMSLEMASRRSQQKRRRRSRFMIPCPKF